MGKSETAGMQANVYALVKQLESDNFEQLGGRIPKAVGDNLRWRAHVLDAAARSKELQAAFRTAARRSIDVYTNTFVWTYNPRKIASNPRLPFITWKYQDSGFQALRQAVFGQYDLIIEKSRDMGASWMCLLLFDHLWLATPGSSFLMMSRTADLVDAPGDPDCLFWKLDYVHKYLPSWLLHPDSIRRTEMHMENLENGSAIDGASTTSNAGVGGRRTAAFFDEFSLVPEAESVWMQSADTTGCRLFNGTPSGTANTFYRITQMVKSGDMKGLRFHWSQHPEKAAGLYHDATGKARSPWYDAECIRRGNNKRQIAAQLDIDYSGASYQFFDADEITRLIDTYTIPPFSVGDFTVDGPTGDARGTYSDREDGPLRLWTYLSQGRPPRDEYVIGIDVATGSGGRLATPSCASVAKKSTGEKVAEFASGLLLPERFGDLLVALCRWFWDARAIWESAGPGTTIRQRFIDHAYSNVYFRTNEKQLMPTPDTKLEMGWYPSPENKDNVLTEYRRALSTGKFLNHSRRALEECNNFIFGPTGHVEHGRARAKEKDDPRGAAGIGANHSDLVIADALCCKLCRTEEETVIVLKQDDNAPPIGCMAWRQEEHTRRERKHTEW